jgi:hypothetical protein
MSQSTSDSKKIDNKKQNLNDFKKKQSYTGRAVKIMAVGPSPTAWKDHLKELIIIIKTT